MQEDVIRAVSNNDLIQQLQFVEQASKKCRITGVRDNRFIVSEDVTISIGDKYETSGEAQATVEWIDTTDLEYVSCSCNRLVYQGMPCMHILHVAQEQKKRIPLLCFNDRFFCQAPMMSLPTFRIQETMADDISPMQDSATLLEQDDGEESDPFSAAAAADIIPTGCANIMLSNLFANNGDEKSVELIAYNFLTIMIAMNGLKPLKGSSFRCSENVASEHSTKATFSV